MAIKSIWTNNKDIQFVEKTYIGNLEEYSMLSVETFGQIIKVLQLMTI